MAERTDEGQAVDIGLADFVTNLPVLPWEADADGAMIWLGPQWEEYAGRPPNSLRGHGWRSLLHPDDAPGTERAWQTALPVRLPFETGHRLRGADGAYRWFLARATPIRDADTGAVRGWVGTCTDVEPLKRLAAQAEAQAVLASEQVAAAHAEAYARERAARAEAEMSARRALVVAEVAQALSLRSRWTRCWTEVAADAPARLQEEGGVRSSLVLER